MNSLKKHSIFIFFFGALSILNLGGLISFRSGFVNGDYALQFLPWSYTYATALKQGYLPLWTPLIGCGFPLFAEGQTAMLYLPNLILFYLLPFYAAYNFVFLIHYLLAAVFAYLFARHKHLSVEAATALALVFCFGSTNAGGFLNVVSLRSLAWFPFCLYSADKMHEKNSFRWGLILSLVMGQCWLAGSPQTSAYACLFIVLYAWLEHKNLEKTVWILLALFISVLFALPQLWATWEFAAHSSRTLLSKDFIFWGSVSPLSLLALFFSDWGALLKTSVYAGIPLLFLALSVRSRDKTAKHALILMALAFFLSLGKYCPLFWVAQWLPGASLLRNPSKFLFFAVFFLTFYAAIQFDEYLRVFKRNQKEEIHRIYKRQLIWLFVFFLIWSLAWLFFTYGEYFLKIAGDFYLKTNVIGKSFHRQSEAFYHEKLNTLLLQWRQVLSFTDFQHWWPIIGGIIALGMTRQMQRFPSKRHLLPLLLLVFVACDLFLFVETGKSIKGNIDYFAKSERRSYDTPNRNLLIERREPGLYAPLVDKDYFLETAGLGLVDDSFGSATVRSEVSQEKKELLDFMNGAEFTLDGHLSKAILIQKQQPMESELDVEVSRETLLTRNQVYDKNWKVFVNGKKQLLQRYKGAFQAIQLPAGQSRVRFVYDAAYAKMGFPLYVGVLLIGFFALFCQAHQKR